MSWKKKPFSSFKAKESQKLLYLKKVFLVRKEKTLINWAVWQRSIWHNKLKKVEKEQTPEHSEFGKVRQPRLNYIKLGKRWKRKLRFWKYRRSRWKRFEHYRRFSVWRWNNLGKWASFQLYPYKLYRRIHQPFRFSKAKQLKKNKWFRLLNKGVKQGFAINRQVRLRNQQQYTKLYSFFMVSADPNKSWNVLAIFYASKDQVPINEISD